MNLIKCSAKAMSLCPDVKTCCSQRHPAEFVEGSECHKFNEEVESLFTNADHIRSMSDEELAEFFIVRDAMKKMYGTYPSRMNEIEEVTKIAWLNWLKQPYKEKEE